MTRTFKVNTTGKFGILLLMAMLSLTACGGSKTPSSLTPEQILEQMASDAEQVPEIPDAQLPHIFDVVWDHPKGIDYSHAQYIHTGVLTEILGENFDTNTVVTVDDEIIKIKPEDIKPGSIMFVFPGSKYHKGLTWVEIRVYKKGQFTNPPHAFTAMEVVYE